MFGKWRSITLFCSIFLHNLSFINIRKLIISTVYIRRILLVASQYARTVQTRTNIEAAKSPWISMPDKLLNQTAKPIVRKSSEWACFFVIVYQSGTCRMCAQRGVDLEMEDVRGKREEREGKREIGKRNTENEAKRGRSARRAERDRGWTEEHVVLFAKTKFARDKHGQTLAGLVDFGVKSATKTQLHFVPTRRILFFYPSFRSHSH